MNIIPIYDRISSADTRCEEIQQELKKLPSNKYNLKEAQSLNQEYLWTVNLIVRLCDDILESEPEDYYGEEVDFRIQMTYFQERYENIKDNITK